MTYLFTEKVRNNSYVENDIFEKVGKCLVNIAGVLTFHLQDVSKTYSKI